MDRRLMLIYSYFMLEQAIVKNIPPPPEVQVPTWHAIARGAAEGNSMPSRYLHREGKYFHYCPLKLEITVLLPNYILMICSGNRSNISQAIDFSISWYILTT